MSQSSNNPMENIHLQQGDYNHGMEIMDTGKNSPDKSEAWHEQKGAGVTQKRNMKDRNIKDWVQTHRTAPCFT